MSNRAKWGLVAALALVWTGFLAIRVTEEPPQRIPLIFRSGQAFPRETVRDGLGVPAVVRPVQAKPGSVPFKPPKNIFASLEEGEEPEKARPSRMRTLTAKKAPLPSVTAPVPAPVPVQASVPSPPSPEELAARQVQQAIAQYRFLGYLTQTGESRAFLGKGQEIYIVKAGDMLDERLRVQTITASAVQLRDAGTSVEATIPLSSTAGRGF